MEISKILSINGKSGLYKLIGQMKNGVIIESLIDGKRSPAHASNQISALEDISVYCTDGDKPFSEVLDCIYKHENGKVTKVDVENSEALKEWFTAVVPEYDQNRVYVSDIKKTAKWYNILHEAGLLKPEEKKEEIAEVAEDKKKSVTKKAKKTEPKVDKKIAPKTVKTAKPKTAKSQGIVKK